MPVKHIRLALCALLLGAPLTAQNVTGSGWTSWGVLPFRGYDFRVMKAPTQYVMYFTHHDDTGTYEGPSLPTARAFSPDLKTWTLDTRDVCSTSGDLCKVTSLLPTTRAVPLAGTLQLPDGRIRMFQNDGKGELKSTISSDGITWTLEPGIRFTQDTTSIYERGNFALQLVSFVTLPNGNIRMYYEAAWWLEARTPPLTTKTIRVCFRVRCLPMELFSVRFRRTAV
jgi:hypothetical protein